MAIVTTGVGVVTDILHEGPSLIFNLVDFLRDNTDWTVAGSCDGTDGGMGTDYITTAADLESSGSWVVLECPGGGPQLLFKRTNTVDIQWTVNIAPNADYVTAATSTNPPDVTTFELQMFSGYLPGNGEARLHITAEDGSTIATAGWALFAHDVGVVATAQCALAFCPVDNSFTEDDYPYVMFIGPTTTGHNQIGWNELTVGTAAEDGVRGIAESDDTIHFFPALIYQSETTIVFPNGCSPSPTGQDVSVPMLHIDSAVSGGAGGWKGVNNFANWNGSVRAPLETFASKTRVSFGYVNFPWDGTTQPTDS